MQICWLLLFLNLHFLAHDSSFVLLAGTVMNVFPSSWHDCFAEVDHKQPLYLSEFYVSSGMMDTVPETSCFQIVHVTVKSAPVLFSGLHSVFSSFEIILILIYATDRNCHLLGTITGEW